MYGGLILLMLLGTMTVGWTGSATLSWVAPPTNEDAEHTPLTDLAGYVVSIGRVSGTAEARRDVGLVTTTTVDALTEGQTYYFTVQAYDTSRNLSAVSEEVSKAIPLTPVTVVPPPTPESPAMLRRVTAGGPAYTDPWGQQWEADHAYTPGGWGYIGGKTSTTRDAIAGTAAGPVYQQERYGTFRYQFTVPNGLYQVTLHMAEIYYTAPGRRLFDVKAEGRLVLDNLDVYAVAGHDRAVWWTFPVRVTDGQLRLDWIAVKGHATVSGIEIQRR